MLKYKIIKVIKAPTTFPSTITTSALPSLGPITRTNNHKTKT